MKMDNYIFTDDEHEVSSAKLNPFFENLIKALEKHHEARAAIFSSESRKFCHDILFKVLVKLAYQNLGVDLSKVFTSLPKGANTKAIKELVASITDRVGQVPRTEGQHRN
jgi:hypothetical protein